MLFKRSLVFILPLLAGAALANAQVASTAGRPPAAAAATSVEDRANALTTNMAQALGLTPAQVEKVRAINIKSVRNVEAARQRYRQDPTKLRGYIEDIGLARLEQLKEVLTPAQFTRYQRKREEKMGIPTTQGAQGTPPPGLGRPDSE
jgi:Spy/CpxP family protein refolding chaperone